MGQMGCLRAPTLASKKRMRRFGDTSCVRGEGDFTWVGHIPCFGTGLNNGTGTSSTVTQTVTAGQRVVVVIDGYLSTSYGPFVLNIASATACVDRDLGSPVGPGVAMGTTVGSSDDVAATCGGATRAPDVSFLWRAPVSGRYTFDTAGSSFDTVLTARSVMCTASELGCSNDPTTGVTHSSLSLTLTSGQTLVLTVDGFNGASGEFVLNIIDPSASCLNGDLGSALGLAVVTGTTTSGASDTSGSCGGSSGPDIAYTWTAPAGGTYTFDTVGSSFDNVLYIKDATCTGTNLVCNNGTGNSSTVTQTVTAGQRVVVVIDGYLSTSYGPFVLNIASATACVDQDLGTATGPGVARGSTTGSSDDMTATCGGAMRGPDVSFLWRAPVAGRYIFDTTGSSFDTVLTARTATCSAAELGCNNDAAMGATHSALTLTVTSGRVLVLTIDGFNGATGDFVLNVAGPFVGCINGDLGSAVGPAVVSGSSIGELGETTSSCGGSGPDVGYTWTAPAAGSYTFNTIGSTFDNVVYLRDGASCTGAELTCHHGTGNSSTITRTLTGGQRVLVVVDGYAGATGNYVLNIH